MAELRSLCRFLERYAPLELAEPWDNVGLLVGRPDSDVQRVMTCLTITPASCKEAIEQGAGLIVSHHPLPFRALKQVTSKSTPGRLLLDLIEAKVAIYSPHTAFDSTAGGINQWFAEGLKLTHIEPLTAATLEPLEPLEPLEVLEADAASQPVAGTVGSGRWGRLEKPTTLADFGNRLKSFLDIQHLHRVGKPDQPVQQVAVGCGAAGEFLATAQRLKCDTLILGETNFHTCLEAEATGIGLLLCGHYASERFAVERLAELIQGAFPDLDVWAAQQEKDPVEWI